MADTTKQDLPCLYLVLEKDGKWAGGYDGETLQPLFGGAYAQLARSIKFCTETRKYGYLQIVSAARIQELRAEKGFARLPSAAEYFGVAGKTTETRLTNRQWLASLNDEEYARFLIETENKGAKEMEVIATFDDMPGMEDNEKIDWYVKWLNEPHEQT